MNIHTYSIMRTVQDCTAGPVLHHTMDTGGLCGSETLGQTLVSHRVKSRHQFADMQMFECRERNTFLGVWQCKIRLLYSTESKTGSATETGITFILDLCKIQAKSLEMKAFNAN